MYMKYLQDPSGLRSKLYIFLLVFLLQTTYLLWFQFVDSG